MKIAHQNLNLARLKIPFYEPVESAEVWNDWREITPNFAFDLFQEVILTIVFFQFSTQLDKRYVKVSFLLFENCFVYSQIFGD